MGMRFVSGNRDYPIALFTLMIHINHGHDKSFCQFGRKKQASVLGRVAQNIPDSVIVRSGSALIGGEDKKRFGGAVSGKKFELNFRYCRSGASDISRRGIHEKILSRSIKSVCFGDFGRGLESPPRDLMNFRITSAARVAHGDSK